MRHPVTILSVPAHDERKLEGCRERGADIIMLDLEDSVPPEPKAQARANLGRHAWPGDLVRVNGAGTEWFAADAEAAIELMPKGIVLPKCEKVADLYLDALDPALQSAGVWLSVESPLGVLALPKLIGPCIGGLLFCHADYMLTAGLYARMGAGVTHAMAQVALYARAYGIPCYDSPSESLAPVDIVQETRRAFHLGFSGKGTYHPAQIPVIRDTWSREIDAQLAAVRGDDLDSWAAGCALTDNGRILAPPSVARFRRLREEAG